MFTLAKTRPEFTFQPDAHKNIGNILNSFGGRVILITSMNPADRISISKIKDQLTLNKITFIQSDQSESFINIEKLNKLKERAEIFNVTSVIVVGGLCQRMSGRYLSQELQLNYIEIPTSPILSYLLESKAICANRIGNDFEVHRLSPDNIKSIIIDPLLLRVNNNIEIILESLTILLNLSQLFLNKNNNLISINESRNLFYRILTDLESKSMDQDKLYIYAITSSLYHGTGSDIDLDLTSYTWTAGYRYNFNSSIACAKILPTFLEVSNESELALRIRELLHSLDITTSLRDLGFTLHQLMDVSRERSEIISIIEKAF